MTDLGCATHVLPLIAQALHLAYLTPFCLRAGNHKRSDTHYLHSRVDTEHTCM